MKIYYSEIQTFVYWKLQSLRNSFEIILKKKPSERWTSKYCDSEPQIILYSRQLDEIINKQFIQALLSISALKDILVVNDIYNRTNDQDMSAHHYQTRTKTGSILSKCYSLNSEDLNLNIPYLTFPKSQNDSITITEGDMKRLEPEIFLNDNIIDFYLKYLLFKIPELKIRFHIFNTFFYKRFITIKNDPYQAVKR